MICRKFDEFTKAEISLIFVKITIYNEKQLSQYDTYRKQTTKKEAIMKEFFAMLLCCALAILIGVMVVL